MSKKVRILRKNLGFEKIKKSVLKEILDEKIDKIEFKNIKIGIFGTVCMICEFSKDGKIISRGVSVRSLLDSFSKNKGKNKAFGLAVKALLSESSSYPIRLQVKDTLITRSLKSNQTPLENETFYRIERFVRDYRKIDNKIYYRINPYLPLAIIASKDIKFKSEFMPNMVDNLEI